MTDDLSRDTFGPLTRSLKALRGQSDVLAVLDRLSRSISSVPKLSRDRSAPVPDMLSSPTRDARDTGQTRSCPCPPELSLSRFDGDRWRDTGQRRVLRRYVPQGHP